MNRIRNRAYTVVKILIVLLLAAVLVVACWPSIHSAEERAKVSRSKADFRTLAIAIEAYHVDFNDYPYYPDPAFAASGLMGSDNPETIRLFRGYTPLSLTTPLAYMSTLPRDAFQPAKGSTNPKHPAYENPLQLYHFDHLRTPAQRNRWEQSTPDGVEYILVGVGPDLVTPISTNPSLMHNNATEYLQLRLGAVGVNGFYDPTNGAVSPGDIVFHGPFTELGFEPIRLSDYGTVLH